MEKDLCAFSYDAAGLREENMSSYILALGSWKHKRKIVRGREKVSGGQSVILFKARVDYGRKGEWYMGGAVDYWCESIRT